MRPIFHKLFPSLRKISNQRTFRPASPKIASSTERGSKSYLQGDSRDGGVQELDEGIGYTMVAMGNQDKGKSVPPRLKMMDDGIRITTEWDVERR